MKLIHCWYIATTIITNITAKPHTEKHLWIAWITNSFDIRPFPSSVHCYTLNYIQHIFLWDVIFYTMAWGIHLNSLIKPNNATCNQNLGRNRFCEACLAIGRWIYAVWILLSFHWLKRCSLFCFFCFSLFCPSFSLLSLVLYRSFTARPRSLSFSVSPLRRFHQYDCIILAFFENLYVPLAWQWRCLTVTNLFSCDMATVKWCLCDISYYCRLHQITFSPFFAITIFRSDWMFLIVSVSFFLLFSFFIFYIALVIFVSVCHIQIIGSKIEGEILNREQFSFGKPSRSANDTLLPWTWHRIDINMI